MGPRPPLWSLNNDAGTYTARIDLENGGPAHAGDVLKGTVTFHTNTSDIRLVGAAPRPQRRQRRIQPGSCFATNPTSNEISTSRWKYAHIFGGENLCENGRVDRNARKAAAPSVAFRVQIADDVAQNFQMHYAGVLSFLEVSVDLPYPSDIQNCLDPSRRDVQASASEADLLEDLIWDPWRSLDDEIPLLPDDKPMYSLSARIPVTILGARKYAVNAPIKPPVHYLDPEGVSSPVLFSAVPPPIEAWFPPSRSLLSGYNSLSVSPIIVAGRGSRAMGHRLETAG
ncbi:hypothetical protein FIBSPDRAFT_1046141 [Athelia psychrophila]|uniref:Uncharacterized protein n=1 Tax=Athelia psychrophila TaxID=1759441 RepID=A0A166H2U6_9AGAM|nr:hypothetical protein FIBSPDRAFT_1046141 [Fibularhizoctonia sp. CBS 109695]